ncbi:MAG: hypothetical protein K2W95_05895 [Candidatus Obscuribacterales bacterium]|nr:hypothetical protein [Candidatus Obscuribacterales bacterium]
MKVKASDPDWRLTTQAIVQAKLLAFRRVGIAAAETQSNGEGDTSIAGPNGRTVVYEIAGNRSRSMYVKSIKGETRHASKRTDKAVIKQSDSRMGQELLILTHM